VRQNKPIARNRKRGTLYRKVETRGSGYSMVTTVGGSRYLVASKSIEHLQPQEEEMLNCSKCDKPSARAIVVYDQDPPPLGEKDSRDVRIVRFCASHWMEVEELLPLPVA
jgi:hypothetical protein